MRYHDITKDDMKNGDGLRVVLWLSGCNHACPGCHNPVTWNPDDGIVFDSNARAELADQLEKSYNSGITFTGGDPMYPGNRQEVRELAKWVKENYPDKTVWMYTGYLWDEVSAEPVMEYVDVLVDGPFLIDLLDTNLLWKGSKNQRVINVKESLSTGSIVLHCGDYKEK